MKKILVTILTVAMLTSAVAAFADGGPQGGPMGGQPPKMEQGRQAPEKPSDAPEKPTGEKPADAPEEPADLTGEKPSDAPEKPTGEKPADAPEKPSGEQGQAPQGRQPADGQQGPRMIDFDAMVTSGVISQETREKIKTYMDEHKPEGEPPVAPTEGQAPADGQQPPEQPEGELPTDGQEQVPDLLSELLNAGIITQAEYDALSAANQAD